MVGDHMGIPRTVVLFYFLIRFELLDGTYSTHIAVPIPPARTMATTGRKRSAATTSCVILSEPSDSIAVI
jgi:hypothetical protein